MFVHAKYFVCYQLILQANDLYIRRLSVIIVNIFVFSFCIFVTCNLLYFKVNFYYVIYYMLYIIDKYLYFVQINSYYKFVMHKIHINPPNLKSSLNISQDQVLNSFYQQRKKRVNSTGRHHSLLQKNSSYFSNANNKSSNQNKNQSNYSQITEPMNNIENNNGQVVSSLNVDKKIANIKDKIMKDMNKDTIASNIMKKYSIGESAIEKNGQKSQNTYVRFQSQKTTPKNINSHKVQLSHLNYQRQNDKGVQGIQINHFTSGTNKQNIRQRHLDELQRSFMSLTSPKNSLISTQMQKESNNNNNSKNNMILSKLTKYVNRNKQNIDNINQQDKYNSVLQNINIVNKMKDSKKSQVQIKSVISEQNEIKKQFERENVINRKVLVMEQMKLEHEKTLQNLRKEYQHKQKSSPMVNKQKEMHRYKNLYHIGTDHQQQFQSPSFKINHDSQESIQRKCKIEHLIQQYDEAVKKQKNKNFNYHVDDQLSLVKKNYMQESITKKYVDLQCEHKKVSQQKQQLLKRIEQLQTINKKQSKFIESVFGMRRTVQKTDNDCSLKQLWRWVKALPLRS